LREGDTFVDVGASVGYYTLVAADAVGERGRVVAFEPAPSSCSILRRNVRLNGFENVTVEEMAVSNEPGSVKLFLAPDNKGDHRIFDGPERRPWVEVDAVTLDGHFDGARRRVDVLKVDVQGAELAVLEGASRLLDENPGIRVVVEFSPSGLAGLGARGSDLLDFLAARDFVWFDLGIADVEVERLEAVGEEWLLARHTVENESYTNHLAVRGRARFEELRRRLARRLEALQPAAPEVVTTEEDRARRAVDDLTRQLVLGRSP
jgi:FkbM family methyltransferase